MLASRVRLPKARVNEQRNSLLKETLGKHEEIYAKYSLLNDGVTTIVGNTYLFQKLLSLIIEAVYLKGAVSNAELPSGLIDMKEPKQCTSLNCSPANNQLGLVTTAFIPLVYAVTPALF